MTSILTVCTGNICRSPAAELLLDHVLGDIAEVSSAGTHALEGHPIPQEMLDELAADDIDGAGHQGRRLTEAIVGDSDLIITMTASHRRRVVQLAPQALKRTFTLAELAAAAGTGATLRGETRAERLADVPRAVAAHRHVLAAYELDDVPDPFQRGQAAYHEAYTLIRSAIVEVSDWIG